MKPWSALRPPLSAPLSTTIERACAAARERLSQVYAFLAAEAAGFRPSPDVLALACAAAALGAPIAFGHAVLQTTLGEPQAGLHLTLAAFSIAIIETILRLSQRYLDAAQAWRSERQTLRVRMDFATAAVGTGLLIGWAGLAALAPLALILTAGVALLWLNDGAAVASDAAAAATAPAERDLGRALANADWVKASGLEMAFARQFERARKIAARYRTDVIFATAARRSIAMGASECAMIAMGALALGMAASGEMTIGMAVACILLSGRVANVLTYAASGNGRAGPP